MTIPEEIELKTKHGCFLIRCYRPGDEKAILSSWKQAFGKDMSIEEWKWKYPFLPEGFACIVCLSASEEIVVHYAGQFFQAFYENQSLLGLQLTDNFSHPRFRWAIGGKTGLFTKVGQIFWQTFLKNSPFQVPSLKSSLPKADFFWGLPGERHFRLGKRLLKYQPLKSGIFFAQRHKGSFVPLRKKFQGIIEKVSLPKGIWKLLELSENDILKRKLFTFSRRKTYWWWRIQRPNKNYEFYYLKSLLGRPKAGLISIVDRNEKIILECLAKDQESLLDLLQRLPKESWKVWLSGNSPWKKYFLEAGFEITSEPLGIIPSFQSFLSNLSQIKTFFHWTMIDADLY